MSAAARARRPSWSCAWGPPTSPPLIRQRRSSDAARTRRRFCSSRRSSVPGPGLRCHDVRFMGYPVAGLTEMRVSRPNGVVAACVWDHAGDEPAERVLASGATAQSRNREQNRSCAREGHLTELFEVTGLHDLVETVVSADLEHPTSRPGGNRSCAESPQVPTSSISIQTRQSSGRLAAGCCRLDRFTLPARRGGSAAWPRIPSASSPGVGPLHLDRAEELEVVVGRRTSRSIRLVAGRTRTGRSRRSPRPAFGRSRRPVLQFDIPDQAARGRRSCP